MKLWIFILIFSLCASMVLAENVFINPDFSFSLLQAGENTIRGQYVAINKTIILTNVTKYNSSTCTTVFVYNITGVHVPDGFSVGNASIGFNTAWMNFTLQAGHNYAIGCGVDGNGGLHDLYGTTSGVIYPINFLWLNFTANGSFWRNFGANNDLHPVLSANYDIQYLGLRTVAVTTSPVIVSSPAINCTVCNIPAGDTVEPYTTADTTPTFTFSTDVSAWCRIGASNVNYSTMTSSRDCSGGEGSLSHTCTLGVADELATSSPTIYASCRSSDDVETVSNSSAKLLMDIVNLSTTVTDAFYSGVQHSVIWPGATIYTDQQVYLRNLQNTQIAGVVDRVVVFGNQRWIFNLASETEAPIGLFNLTPAVYSLELINVSSSQIESKVSALINATKN